MLSEVDLGARRPLSALARLDRLAPTLSAAELRIALKLTLLSSADEDWCIRMSARELAWAAGLARSTVRVALESLLQRKLVSVRPGTAVVAAAYRLEWMSMDFISGPGGPEIGPGVDLFSAQGGPKIGPPLIENAELANAVLPLDIEGSTDVIDRFLKSHS